MGWGVGTKQWEEKRGCAACSVVAMLHRLTWATMAPKHEHNPAQEEGKEQKLQDHLDCVDINQQWPVMQTAMIEVIISYTPYNNLKYGLKPIYSNVESLLV